LAAQPQPGPSYPSPRLFVVSPLGVERGATVELSLSGLELDEPRGLLFSFQGGKVEFVEVAKPDKPTKPPTTTTTVRYRVTVPKDLPVGTYDVRVVAKGGVTNPRAFVVGDLPEVLEKEGNDDVPQAQRVPLNCTVSGDIGNPTDVDYFLFEGKKGQRVVASCLAQSIDSKLQPAIEIYRKGAGALASNRDYLGTDAVADAVLPADGEYYVRVYRFAFTQADREHFYRLTISTAPWIDAIVPSVLEPGRPNKVTIYGRNLPNGVAAGTDPEGMRLEKLDAVIDAPKQVRTVNGYIPPRTTGLDVFTHRVKNAVGSSNAYPLYLAQARVVASNGKNTSQENAQQLPTPCEVAGVLDRHGRRDWYSFTAKRGEVLSIEFYGDRIGANMDLYAQVRDGAGKVLGDLDDYLDAPLNNHFYMRTDDPSRFRFTAPADGTYFVTLSSRESMVAAGTRYQYRLRVTEEKPDFRVVLIPQNSNDPEACNLAQGGKHYFIAHVWRQDGFEGAITLAVAGLPKGVVCPPQTIGPGQRQATLVFSAADNAEPWAGPVTVTATATIKGQKVVRDVHAASVTWPLPFQQPQIPRLSRLDRQIVVGVADVKPQFVLEATGEAAPVLQGGRITVGLKVNRGADAKNPIAVFAMNQPSSATGPKPNPNQPLLTFAVGKDDGSVTLDVPSTTPPGVYTVVFRGVTQVPPAKPTMAKPQNLTLTLPSSPITITVLPKQLGDVTLSTGNVNLARGKEVELIVRVRRLFDYQGEFKIELVVPENAKGVTAAAVTLSPGQDEAKLLLKADADAATGNRTGLIVRATALFEGKTPTTQEAKLNVNVQK
jgi:hypothetical protein